MALPSNCPLCSADRSQLVVVTNHVYGDQTRSRAFFRCKKCDVRFQFPGLTAEEEARFYAGEFENFMAGRAGVQGGWKKIEDHHRANEPTRLRRMKYLTPHLCPSSELLEIGCSSGFMLFPLITQGIRCTGVEPSGAFSQYLESRAAQVYQSLDQLMAAHSAKRFDLIMHFFVLEHIADPASFLESQLRLLKPDGKIIFEIPNVADPLHSVYDIPDFERFYWSIAHPWYFSEASLQHLLEQVGKPYQILLDQRYDLSNHMVWARDGRPGGMGRFTERLGVELEDAYKDALIRTGNCDTLIAIVSNS